MVDSDLRGGRGAIWRRRRALVPFCRGVVTVEARRGRKLNGGKSLRTKGNVQMHRCACDGMCARIRVEMHVHARMSMCLLTCELESVYVCVFT